MRPADDEMTVELDVDEMLSEIEETPPVSEPAAVEAADEAPDLDFDIGGEGAPDSIEAAGSGPLDPKELDSGSDLEADNDLDFGLDLGDENGTSVAAAEPGGELPSPGDDAELDFDLNMALDDDATVLDLGTGAARESDSDPSGDGGIDLDLSLDAGGDVSVEPGGRDHIETVQINLSAVRPTDTDPTGDDPAQVPAGSGLDLDFDADLADLSDLGDLGDGGTSDDEEARTLVLGRTLAGEVDEIEIKLELAQTYIEMENLGGAREILGEVLAEGDAAQQEMAKALLAKLA